MTSNLCLMLALSVGQVPASTYTPYGQSYYQSAYPQSGFRTISPTEAAPKKSGTLKSFFQNVFNVPPQNKVYYPAVAPRVSQPTSYTAAATRPQVPSFHSNQHGSYHPVTPARSTPVSVTTTPTPVGIHPTHEESSAPPLYKELPGLIQPALPQQPRQVHVVPTNPGQPAPIVEHMDPAELPLVESPTPVIPAPAGPPSKLQVAKKYENHIGHEEDYSWITGHLFHVHADGGRWIVRYALPGEVDKYGGSVVLAAGVEMKNFRDGDLVCIYGEVINEARTSKSLGGALYRVNSIQMIERAD